MDYKRFRDFIQDLRDMLDNCETFCKEQEYIHIEYSEVKMRMEKLIEEFREAKN